VCLKTLVCAEDGIPFQVSSFFAASMADRCRRFVQRLQACHPSPHYTDSILLLHPKPNSFEVFGFDVILDDASRPWLVEVNSSPALSRTSKLDDRIKTEMIRDTVRLINPPAINHGALVDVLERRMNECRPCDRSARWKPTVKPHGGAQASNDSHCNKESKLDADVRSILGTPPRAYGEMPAEMGLYQRIAPGTDSFKRFGATRGKVVGSDDVTAFVLPFGHQRNVCGF
jgi:hypothetical protein